MPTRSPAAPTAALLALLCAGCSSGPKNFENENDLLRRRVMEMEKQIAALTAEQAELRAKLSESTPSGVTKEWFEALPVCATIEIDKLSTLVDEDGVPGYEAIDFYVRPLDGKGRFLQITGNLTVRATLLPAAPNEAENPRVLALETLGPAALRDAYRSSFMGTHYTIRTPLEDPNQTISGKVALEVSFQGPTSLGPHTASGSTLPLSDSKASDAAEARDLNLPWREPGRADTQEFRTFPPPEKRFPNDAPQDTPTSDPPPEIRPIAVTITASRVIEIR